jgi:hydrogenase expression/formation protein HypC
MKVEKIEGDFAQVKAAGFLRKINIQMIPQVKTGDYVMVHAGFAIQIINEREAQETLRLINEIH